MARHRSRSRSYSPRHWSHKKHHHHHRHDDDDDDRRSRRERRRSSAPTGLLIRNLPLDAQPEDLKVPFEKFGPVKDVYLPKHYYTGEPRGFGFVKFCHAADAAEAKERMNYKIIGGREIRIVFAEENRKTPKEMRVTSRISGRYGGRGRTPPRSPRRRHRSYSRSPSCPRHDSRDHGVKDDSHSQRRPRSISRSRSPREDQDYRLKDRRSRSITRSRSPQGEQNDRLKKRRLRSISRSHSPQWKQDDRSKQRRGRSNSHSRSPRDEQDHKENRLKQRPSSPRENSQSAHDQVCLVSGRSRSPRYASRSPSASPVISHGSR